MSGLERLPARRPAALLEELEALAARGRGGEPVVVPMVTLLLSGGHTITGRFVAYQAEQRGTGASVVVHTSDTRGRFDAAYAPLEAVVAVIVHHEPATIAPLSGGRVAPVPVDPPGKLAVERKVSDLVVLLRSLLGVERPIAVDWEALGTSDHARAAVSLLLDALRPILSGIAADDMGRDALIERTDRIRVTAGRSGGARLEARVLTIALERDGEQVLGARGDALRKEIEGLL